MFAVSSHDEHFWDDVHHDRLVELADRMEFLRETLGARQKTFAGILPGVLTHRGILTDPPERDVTAAVITQAVHTLRRDQSDTMPVIVLGGQGFIGKRLVDVLEPDMPVYPVDLHDADDRWPTHLAGQPAILVNVASRNALAQYLDRLWPGMTVLNEVYPEPSPEVIEQLTAKGIDLHHVVGVAARAFPPFPAAYRGAIPCCAAWPADDSQVVTRQLT